MCGKWEKRIRTEHKADAKTRGRGDAEKKWTRGQGDMETRGKDKQGETRQETGDRGQETGDRRQETGDRRQETGGVSAYKLYSFRVYPQVRIHMWPGKSLAFCFFPQCSSMNAAVFIYAL